MLRLTRRGEVAEVRVLTSDEDLALRRAFGRYGKPENRAVGAVVVRRYQHSGAGHWFLCDCLGDAAPPPALVPVTEDHLRRHSAWPWPRHDPSCDFYRDQDEQRLICGSYQRLAAGKPISLVTRYKSGDPFEFSPQFKLWIAGNHRPTLRNPDPAMRRRLHLVPLTFVPPMPDPSLAAALRAELPGILAWAIVGCLAWQRERLQPPETVRDATADYFAEQDAVANWIAERCERVATARTSPGTLFTDWRQWATARGEEPGTEKRFSGELERYFAKGRTKAQRFFAGVKLRPADTGAW